MKPGLIIGTVLIVFCTVIAAVALSGSSRKSITFADARRLSEPCEIYGAVVPHRTKFDLASSRLSFALQEEKTGAVMPVVYTKVKPASFDQASHVKAIGVFSGDHFEADSLLVKCPSKYQGTDRIANPEAARKVYATGN
jgi:cytochrome c-type biogenesis protein CcmE